MTLYEFLHSVSDITGPDCTAITPYDGIHESVKFLTTDERVAGLLGVRAFRAGLTAQFRYTDRLALVIVSGLQWRNSDHPSVVAPRKPSPFIEE